MKQPRATRRALFTGILCFLGVVATSRNCLAQQQIDWTISATDHRGENGKQFTYICPSTNTVPFAGWGTDIYTDDTRICPAAVHAGLITASGGIVSIEIRPGETSYRGTARNGTSTQDHGGFVGSYVFVSPIPIPIPIPTPTSTSTSTPTDEQVVTFDHFKIGPLAPNAIASQRVELVPQQGVPSVYEVGPNMVLPAGHSQVLLIDGGPQTQLTITFSAPIKRFSLTRIGTSGGSSVPTWNLEAYDSEGKVVSSTGEEHGLPSEPGQFFVEGSGIIGVRLSTDNRFGAGTWATWNSLPVVEFRIQP